MGRFGVHPGEKVVVAVSGGPDSVCLLHLLKQLFPDCPLSLHIAHLNHGLRTEAVRESRFVEDLSKDLKLPFTVADRPVRRFCRENHCSLQAGARAVRYQFLKEVAEAVEATWIATGHTADDQAETFLMRALRGAGTGGLSGIREVREDGIIRPLLQCARSEILEMLSKEKIPYIEDPSNHKMAYQRNRIRHALIPVLETYNPQVKEALCREAGLLREEDDFIHQSMRSVLTRLKIRADSDSLSLDIQEIRSLHPALQRRVLRWGVEKVLGKGRGLDFQSLEILRTQLLPCAADQKWDLPQSLSAKKTGFALHLKREQRGRQKAFGWYAHSQRKRVEIDRSMIDTQIDLQDWGLSMRISFSHGLLTNFSSCTASFDFDKFEFPLSIRGWRPGDRFLPLGMKGRSKKLQDFFVDAKVPRFQRHRIPILVCPKGILWVVGFRIDERFRASHESHRIMKIVADMRGVVEH